MTIELLNIDCMEYMETQHDNAFDLAIVDPPYGIGFDGEIKTMTNHTCKKWNRAHGTGYERKDWDKEPPSQEYFDELMRVSKDQIIWGGNYFRLPQSSGWIFWDKSVAKDFTLSPGELAWTSYPQSIKKIDLLWAGFRKCEKGKRILDTHLGSGSSAIAAHYFGCNFVGCEIDADYYAEAKARFDIETAQHCIRIGIEKDPKYFDIACERIEGELAQGRLF